MSQLETITIKLVLPANGSATHDEVASALGTAMNQLMTERNALGASVVGNLFAMVISAKHSRVVFQNPVPLY